ncbi:hypothetical protein [Bradyrhizobium sp. USDA 4350]
MLSLFFAAPGGAAVWRAASAAVGFILKCTPCLIAIAIGAAWVAGAIHEKHVVNAEWSAKWSAAEAKAEHDRKARDAFAKAKIEADANDRLAGVAARASQLEAKVRDYEKDEELRRATGGDAAAIDHCLTDQSDDQWLRDIRRKRKSSAGARGRLADRLRSHFAGSRDPGKP